MRHKLLKKLVFIIALSTCILGSATICSFAENPFEDESGILYYGDEEAAIVIDNSKYDKDFAIIPKLIENEGETYVVTQINENAFIACDNLKDVYIERRDDIEEDTYVVNNAFKDDVNIWYYKITDVDPSGNIAYVSVEKASGDLPDTIACNAMGEGYAIINANVSVEHVVDNWTPDFDEMSQSSCWTGQCINCGLEITTDEDPTQGHGETPVDLPGDLNNDEHVNITDLQWMCDILYKSEDRLGVYLLSEAGERADFDKDGNVTDGDLQVLLNILDGPKET